MLLITFVLCTKKAKAAHVETERERKMDILLAANVVLYLSFVPKKKKSQKM